jgi:hypothetical protein
MHTPSRIEGRYSDGSVIRTRARGHCRTFRLIDPCGQESGEFVRRIAKHYDPEAEYRARQATLVPPDLVYFRPHHSEVRTWVSAMINASSPGSHRWLVATAGHPPQKGCPRVKAKSCDAFRDRSRRLESLDRFLEHSGKAFWAPSGSQGKQSAPVLRLHFHSCSHRHHFTCMCMSAC